MSQATVLLHRPQWQVTWTDERMYTLAVGGGQKGGRGDGGLE